jgi:3-oxoadipate enol-lactonase
MKTSNLHYRIDGSGPRVLLLHPVGLDLTFFEPLAEELSQSYRVLRIDMRGHGGSPPGHDAHPPHLEDYADDIHALLRELRYTPAAVIGFSFGGMLAQHLAFRHQGDVNALVASACSSTLSDASRKAVAERGAVAEREGMAAVVDATIERWFTDAFRQAGGDDPVRRRLLSNDVRSWREAWTAIAQVNTAPYLSSIKVPTLCLAGGCDVSAPPPVVEAIAKGIPGACFAVIPGAPHMLFIEQPQTVAIEISDFLGRVLVA